MTDTNITELRPSPRKGGGSKDPTNAERSRRFRAKRKAKRSVAQWARNANEPVAAAVAPVTILQVAPLT
jgi:hypothetical protein